MSQFKPAPKMPVGDHEAILDKIVLSKKGQTARLSFVFKDRTGKEAWFASNFGHTQNGFSEKGLNFAHGQLKALGVDGKALSDLLRAINEKTRVVVTVEQHDKWLDVTAIRAWAPQGAAPETPEASAPPWADEEFPPPAADPLDEPEAEKPIDDWTIPW